MQVEPSNNVLNTSWIKPAADGAEHRMPASEAVINELGRDFAAALEKALQSCQSDPKAVQEAKAAAAAGTLETSTAFAGAAENILRFGM